MKCPAARPYASQHRAATRIVNSNASTGSIMSRRDALWSNDCDFANRPEPALR
jgi:hypothetical protein